MAVTTKISPDLYSKPPLNPMPGARCDIRTCALGTADLSSTTATTQFVALAPLPAGAILKQIDLEAGALDGSAGLVFQVGILSSYYNQAVNSTSVPANFYISSAGAAGTAMSQSSPYNMFSAITNTDASTSFAQTIAGASAVSIGQSAGYRITLGATSNLTTSIGVDPKNDRIIAIQFGAAANVAQAGNITVITTIDWP